MVRTLTSESIAVENTGVTLAKRKHDFGKPLREVKEDLLQYSPVQFLMQLQKLANTLHGVLRTIPCRPTKCCTCAKGYTRYP